MPSKTLEDRVDELTKLAHGLAEQVRALDGQLSGVVSEKAGLGQEVSGISKMLAVVEQKLLDLRAWKDSFGTIDQIRIDNALLRKEVEELKKWQDEVKKQKDELGRRLWGLAAPIVGAIVGWLLGYLSRPH